MNESVIDHWVTQAVNYYEQSDVRLKICGLYAAPVVGTYQRDGTKAIADGIGRSLSTVENYAHAAQLYQELRKNTKVRKRIRTLWRSLPASHWWSAWQIQNAGYDAFYYLDHADIYKLSGRDMMQEYKADRDAGTVPMLYDRGMIALSGLVRELLQKHYGKMDENLRSAMMILGEALDRIANEGEL
jgi:hypothetical protein